MKQTYTLNALFDFVNKYPEAIDNIKITHFEHCGFNAMEGCQYEINFKIITVPKYRNKLIKVITNSTWLEDYGNDDETIKAELLDTLLTEVACAKPILNE